MSTVRWIIAILLMAAFSMQVQLWLSADGYRKTRSLRVAVANQSEQNASLAARNQALDAEVTNLKQRREAAEERARSNLGMIGKHETFYQVIPATDETS